jgi:hypothetical protein
MNLLKESQLDEEKFNNSPKASPRYINDYDNFSTTSKKTNKKKYR